MDQLDDLHQLLSTAYDLDMPGHTRKLPVDARGLSEALPCLTPAHTNAQAQEFFTHHPQQDNVAVVEDGRPIGMINKNIFMEAYAKPYAREVFGLKSCMAWMHKEPLVVEEKTAIETLLSLAVARGEQVLRDGFVTTRSGQYGGIGTGFSLMQAMSELEAAKTRQLLDSIHYASSIQQAHLRDSREHLVRALADHALIWEPRDVVGGDCFFVRHFAHGSFIAVIDCTGHGVPGAFMTLIALSWLEQRIQPGQAVEAPGQILAELNAYVKRVLDQDGAMQSAFGAERVAYEGDDGMDAAVVWLPHGAPQLLFAGSHLSLLVAPVASGEVAAVDGDKCGVGYAATPVDAPWATHRVRLDGPTRLLIVTDGVIDQLGGPKNIALGKRRLVQWLAERSGATAADLGTQLQAYVNDWQGEQVRRDDVTALCFTAGVST